MRVGSPLDHVAQVLVLGESRFSNLSIPISAIDFLRKSDGSIPFLGFAGKKPETGFPSCFWKTLVRSLCSSICRCDL